ncbi:apolipoprotein N-acyltransferase [soil metagenome]
MIKPPFEPKIYLLLAVSGAGLGLSAPGFEQWYLAWFGLVPLLLAATSSKGMWQALLRGLTFGSGYSLVYLNWFLDLQPLDWLNFNGWQGWLLAGAAWAFVSGQQALIVSLFALAINKLPMVGAFFPANVQKSWKLPALITVPLAWLLVTNFLGNAHSALGVPWTMLEYSQYKQVSLIQIASIIGGVGVGYLIVLCNTAIASLIATRLKKWESKSLVAASERLAIYQMLAVAGILIGSLAFGFQRTSTPLPVPEQSVSVLQGNINIEMERSKHRYSLTELLVRYMKLLAQCPRGLIVWTENALPAYLIDEPGTTAELAAFAKRHESDMVVGSMYHDDEHTPFNSAYGITSGGELVSEVYSKRYLVPFGEYTPSAVRNMPEWLLRLTNTPAGGGFGSGKTAVALPLSCGQVSPLICFETLSPELCASSVRKGGQLLVNISDLAWFHRSMVGQQMIAFSVFRAVENGRYFVFAANTGPSAIIDTAGRIKELSGQEKDLVLIGKVALSSELTTFTHWFIF